MRRIPGLRRAFRLPWSSTRVERDVDDELRFHLDMKTQELIDAGAPPDDARRLATAQFGDVDYTRRYMRHTDHGRMVHERRAELGDELRQDLRFSLRQLARNPVFTAVALITLALGIGANTAIFSVVRGVLLRDLPYAEPDRLLRAYATINGRRTAVSPADFADWRRQSRSFSALAASYESTVTLTGSGAAERFSQARVSANLFALLGVRPTVGRAFADREDAVDAPRVAILSDGAWRRRFGADSTIVGKAITLDGYPTTVIGVAPPDMRYPSPVDMWLTARFTARDLSDSSRGSRWLDVVGRLAPGVTAEQAQREMTTIARRLEAQDPRHDAGVRTGLVSLREDIVGDVRAPLIMLLAAVGFVMLIACANVASLLLGRTAARESELAVRTTLGAGRSRLVRQMLTESVSLALIGGALGLALAMWGTRLLLVLAPSDIPRLYNVRVDAPVLLFTLGATALAALLFGTIPALHASAGQLALTLREGNRGSRTRPGSARARGALVVAEITLALMLLVGAGLLLKSFTRLRDVSPGFKADRVSTFTVTLSPDKYATPEQQRAFGNALLEEVHRIPGVDSAAVTFGLPLSGQSFQLTFDVAGREPPSPNAEPRAQVRVVSPGYFATVGVPVVRGRAFTAADRAGAQRALLISQETARRFFPGEDPIGKRLAFGWTQGDERLAGEIVGIVGDVRHRSLSADVTPHVYAAFDQWPLDEITVVMRTRGDPAVPLRAAQATVARLDRDLPVYDAFTLETMVDRSLGQPRFYVTLLTVFATLALVLAVVGIYGIIAYTVQQRTREIGIRIALGASTDRVVGMVVRRGLALAAAGVLLGSVGAYALSRVLRSQLYGVGERDPLTFVGVAALLGVVALVASWIPARRAALVDPLTAMRADS
ncbi:MAG TPA: ABC transporter permease [Gemmatimonadaceae bacterium]|nr:ABC transporter permease [Gemmatimonadaceae bacterium]